MSESRISLVLFADHGIDLYLTSWHKKQNAVADLKHPRFWERT